MLRPLAAAAASTGSPFRVAALWALARGVWPGGLPARLPAKDGQSSPLPCSETLEREISRSGQHQHARKSKQADQPVIMVVSTMLTTNR